MTELIVTHVENAVIALLPNAISFSVTSFQRTAVDRSRKLREHLLDVARGRDEALSDRPQPRSGSATPAASFNRPAARLPSARRPSRTCKVLTPPSIRPVIALVLRGVTSSLAITNSNAGVVDQRGQDLEQRLSGRP